MKKRILSLIVLFAILIIASALRLYHLGATPISLNWDEAALGYNAYSIFKTGKDEYGTVFPFILRSFGNYTPALYSYLIIPALSVFDLNQFAVRLPAAVLGIFTVLGSFFLVQELLSLHTELKKRSTIIALITAFLMAISPWHLQFSRIAYEAASGLTLTVWGMFALLKARKQAIWFLATAFFFGLSLHAYHSSRLFTPVFLLGYFCIELIKSKKLIWKTLFRTHILLSIVVFACFLIPFGVLIITGQSHQITARFQATTSLNSEQKEQKPTIIETIARGYLSHASLPWMFSKGDNDRHHAPSTGLLYIWELPFFLFGLYAVFTSKGIFRLFTLLWLFTVPLPASLTSEVPHAVRTLLWLPLPHLFTALGLYKCVSAVFQKQKRTGVVFGLGILLIICLSFIEYFELYHKHMNLEKARFWQFGYEHAVNFVNQNQSRYDAIVVSQKLEQPYIFFLFYNTYDPVLYLKNGGTPGYTTQSFEKYIFTNIDWDKRPSGNVLYVLHPEEAATAPIKQTLHTIRYFDSNPAMVFVE